MNNFIVSEGFALFDPIEDRVDELTRTALLKTLLLEAEKPRVNRLQLDTIDRHMTALRQLTYRQVELVEKGHRAERALTLIQTINDLMANYQNLRRRIGAPD